MNTQYKHQSIAGLSSTNLIFDKDLLALSDAVTDTKGRMISAPLAGHANEAEILAVPGESIDREDNGFRNIDKPVKVSHEGLDGGQHSTIESSTHNSAESDPLSQLVSDDTGTSQIMEHCGFYLGEIRAWRNGWNPKAYKRHAKASSKAQAFNGVVWGEWCDIAKKATSRVKAKATLAALEAKAARREARKLAKLAAKG